MSRIHLNSGRAKGLIEKTIQVFLAAGSTAGLVKLLNENLEATGVGPALHANRLHALLSGDAGRGLNERTFELIEQTVGRLIKDPRMALRAEESATRLRSEALELLRFGGVAWDEVPSRLSIPPAVLTMLLPRWTASEEATERVKSSERARTPDWSYQDVAVARCLDALTSRPAPRIGLVLPTGGGKTRTALRIALFMLKSAANGGRVIWITHRRNLRAQAHRELQKLLAGPSNQIPDDAAGLLGERIDFVMLSEVGALIETSEPAPTLVIIDEAHHAAAASYAPVFESSKGFPTLLLTATPNRSDNLPIGIDEIAYTITYRELAERGAILRPSFLDFPVNDFDWSASAIEDLADYVVEHSAQEFQKTLILAPRVDRVEEFYEALRARLAVESGHPLDLDDLGYIHGGRNSAGIENEDFLARFATKPRAVIVSAQLLLEGFDDPAVDTVIITYATQSVIRLMQAAGRCVRYAPGKSAAFVVQARNDQIAYHFDHRWLYQEIDDFLRPELVDIEYGSIDELKRTVVALLERHNVDSSSREAILTTMQGLQAGELCRIFFHGLPYYGPPEGFTSDSRWSAFLEVPNTSTIFRSIFNGFSAIGADISDPSDYLLRDGQRHGLAKDFRPDSEWMAYIGMLTACYFAKREVYGPGQTEGWGRRPHQRNGHTTWLKYVTFSYRPSISPAFLDFLSDCHNAAEIQAAYLVNKAQYAGAVKFPLILGGSEAFLLSDSEFDSLTTFSSALRDEIAGVPPGEQYSTFAAAMLKPGVPLLPHRLIARIDALLGDPLRSFSLKQLNEASIGDIV